MVSQALPIAVQETRHRSSMQAHRSMRSLQRPLMRLLMLPGGPTAIIQYSEFLASVCMFNNGDSQQLLAAGMPGTGDTSCCLPLLAALAASCSGMYASTCHVDYAMVSVCA